VTSMFCSSHSVFIYRYLYINGRKEYNPLVPVPHTLHLLPHGLC